MKYSQAQLKALFVIKSIVGMESDAEAIEVLSSIRFNPNHIKLKSQPKKKHKIIKPQR